MHSSTTERGATGSGRISYDELVRRAERYARERLAGVTLINHATQLAITLTPDALKAATAPGAPADLLRLFPRLPQLLSDALYVRTTADPQQRPDIRRVHVLVARGPTAARALDVFFVVRENFQSQCFLDRISARRSVERRRGAGGEAPDAQTSTSADTAPPRYIFVGGWDDDRWRPVADYVDKFRQAHDGSDIHYFPWTDANGILNAIRNAPAGAPVNVIGHSYGAHTAAFSIARMAPTGIHVNKLITIDAVGRQPIPDGLRGAVGTWVNVTATPSMPNESDSWAAAGGKGARLPADQADRNYSIDTNHAEFTRMMTTPGPGGLSPEKTLLGDDPPQSTSSPRPNNPPGGN